MLNKPLYNALCEAFDGDVRIIGEGNPLIVLNPPKVTGRWRKDLSEVRIASDMVDEGGEHYAVNCPFCNDRKHRLWVCHAWGSFVELEGFHIPVSRALVHCYNELCLTEHDNWVKFCEMLEGKWKPAPVEHASGSSSIDFKPSQFPEPTWHVNLPGIDTRVQQYLTGRGYNLDELARVWDFRVGKIDIYDIPVVIMPVTYNGTYKFWQARYPMTGDVPERFSDGRVKPRYYLPSGSKKSSVLYNLHNAIKTDYVVLVEGIFDAVRVGTSGVAMFGKMLSTLQEQMLYNMAYNKKIVVIPDMDDPDAIHIARKAVDGMNVRQIFKEGVYLLELENGDPAEYKREELWASIKRLAG